MLRSSTFAVIACGVGVVACGRPPTTEREPGASTLALVVRVRVGPRMDVPVAVVNRSATPFRCAARGGRDLLLATSTLFRNGRPVTDAFREPADDARIGLPDVVEIPPGEVRVFSYPLPYSNVSPGVYELRVRDLSGTALPQVTPASFEQWIVLDVVAE